MNRKRSHWTTKRSRYHDWTRNALAILLLAYLPVASKAATLDDIRFTSLSGDRAQIQLQLSEPLAEAPLSFTVDNPARIAMDFPNTELNLPTKTQPIGIGAAESIRAVQAGDRTRVVVNLVHMVPYDITAQGNSVLVTLQSSGRELDDVLPVTAGAPATDGASIETIDFRRGPKGEGRIVVNLSDPNVGVLMREQGDKIVVDFVDTRLPERLDRTLDVVDFATPVTEIDTFAHGNGTRMLISPTGFYEHLAYQSDTTMTIEIKPLTKAEQEAIAKEKFNGERLSLNFQNIEVRAVLQLIADFTELNMVASDSVGGNVTLRLKNVPWDQALDIILKSKGLGMRQHGNVIMVAPQEEIAAREKLELEAQQQLAELAPLRTEFIQINYAKAGDISKLIKDEANNLLSERGNLSVDERTNTLLVQDTAEKLQEMRKVIATLDVAVRQVLIDSRIVIANEDFSRDLGVKFGYSKNTTRDGTAANDRLFGVLGGKLAGDTDFGGGTAFTTDDQENFLVNLPVADPAGALGLAVGKIGSYLLQLELSALQAEGRGEVVSNPRVITANQREAVIEQGSEIPFQQATSSGATSTTFKKAVLSLQVTPQITPDDRIILDLQVNKDAVGEQTPGGLAIDTNSVTTQVLVDNGETVVLGGVFEHTKRNAIRRVPFFGELPYVGALFKNTTVENDKNELLIFVTPKILKDNLALH